MIVLKGTKLHIIVFIFLCSRLTIKHFFCRFPEFEGPIGTEDNIDSQEYNVFLEYCFPDIYGPNFGFSTLIEFEDECIIGQSCTDTGESMDIEEDLNDSEIDIGMNEIATK